MTIPQKTSSKSKKRKSKIKIKESAEIRKKNSTLNKRDSIPLKTYVPDNGVTFKIKIRRKR